MCEKVITENLVAIAESYAELTGKSLTTVSKEFYGRGDFLNELRDGSHTISIKRLDDILNKFRAKWPPRKARQWPKVQPALMKYSRPSGG